MALVRKTLLSLTGSETIDGPEYEVIWKVTTNSVNDGPFAVRGYVGVAFGDVYAYGIETDILARCSRINERPIGSSKVDWEVTLNYTRPPREEAGERSESNNPLNDPIQIEFGSEDRQRQTNVDITGKPILNPVGDFFDELATVDDFRRTITIVRNEATFPRALADSLSNRVNVGPWNGYPAKAVKIKPITATSQWNTAIGRYWAVRYEFVIAPIGDCGCANEECPNPCPVIELFESFNSDCQVRWRVATCGDPASLTITLYRVGDPANTRIFVEPEGELHVIGNSDYLLTVRYPGCADVEQTIHVGTGCPCLTGCVPRGAVAISPQRFATGGSATATIVVSGFQNRVLTTDGPGFIPVCRRTDYENLTGLNHTATFPILTATYTEQGKVCTLHYIEPTEYYIGRINTRVEVQRIGGGTIEVATAAFDVFGVIRSTIGTGGLTIDDGYSLRMDRVSSGRIESSVACSNPPFFPTIFAPYDTGRVDESISWNTIHEGVRDDGTTTGQLYPSNIVGAWHPPWCMNFRTRAFFGDANNSSTHYGYFTWLTNANPPNVPKPITQ